MPHWLACTYYVRGAYMPDVNAVLVPAALTAYSRRTLVLCLRKCETVQSVLFVNYALKKPSIVQFNLRQLFAVFTYYS